MYLILDLVGPIYRLSLVAITILKWWFKGCLGNVLSLFQFNLYGGSNGLLIDM